MSQHPDWHQYLSDFSQPPNGMPLDLVKRIFSLQESLGFQSCSEMCLKKLKFWGYELQIMAPLDMHPMNRLELLRDFIFEKKKFCALTPCGSHGNQRKWPLSSILLHEVFEKRVGHPLAIGLLFHTLSQFIRVSVHFVSLRGFNFLKYVHEGNAYYMDLCNRGHFLEPQDILNLLHGSADGHSPDNQLDEVDIHTILEFYLRNFESVFRASSDIRLLLITYSFMLALKPTSVSYLAKRARIHAAQGQLREALTDLRRYFLHCDGDRHSPEIVMLYQKLCHENHLPGPPHPTF
jgi:regulator of sirC expression with transglutaminase-like and TPR domain